MNTFYNKKVLLSVFLLVLLLCGVGMVSAASQNTNDNGTVSDVVSSVDRDDLEIDNSLKNSDDDDVEVLNYADTNVDDDSDSVSVSVGVVLESSNDTLCSSNSGDDSGDVLQHTSDNDWLATEVSSASDFSSGSNFTIKNNITFFPQSFFLLTLGYMVMGIHYLLLVL